MKKFLSLILALSLTLSLAACGSKGDDNADPDNTNQPADAVELLTTAWDAFTEDQKFAAVGGDGMSEETTVDGAPGRYSVADGETLYYALSFPAESVALIDDAASLIHMMNANTFTAGAFHVSDSANVETLASAVKDSVASRQWMCGFPDKMVVMTIGSYVVSFYGFEDNVNTFRDNLTAAYEGAVIVCDEPIA